MSMINYASREINCKLVYYGPGLGVLLTRDGQRRVESRCQTAGESPDSLRSTCDTCRRSRAGPHRFRGVDRQA